MKKVFLILLSAGIILSCNSHKKSSRSSKGGSYSSSTSANTSSAENISYTKPDSSKTSQNGLDSAMNNYDSGNPQRAFTNFGGAVGIGTGGSYASHSYRHDLMNKKNKRREYFKKRMKEFDRDYYGEEEARAIPAMLQDSTSVLQDSLSTTNNLATDTSAFATDEW